MKEQIEEKVIEEMAFDLCLIDRCKHLPKEECHNTTCAHCEAESLYNAGYRKQKEGEWIEHIEKPDWLEDDVEVFYECSVCETKSPAPTNYCPNCGAHMRGGKNE